MLRSPGYGTIEEGGSDATAPMFAAHHEARHPPRVGIVVEDPCECRIAGYPMQG